MANKRKAIALKRNKAHDTFDVDIGQEFRDVKSAISKLRDDLNDWKNIFNAQLTRLNDNMTSVLNTLANHEQRLTELEQKTLKSETKHETISELSKFGWWALKAAVGAGIIIGSVLGTAGAWRTFFGG